MDVPIPFSPVLEDQTVPTAAAVFEMAKTLCRGPASATRAAWSEPTGAAVRARRDAGMTTTE
jgi:hypothetical protein